MNMTYNDAMDDSSTQDFRDISENLCAEVRQQYNKDYTTLVTLVMALFGMTNKPAIQYT